MTSSVKRPCLRRVLTTDDLLDSFESILELGIFRPARPVRSTECARRYRVKPRLPIGIGWLTKILSWLVRSQLS